jgi:glutathione synthase
MTWGFRILVLTDHSGHSDQNSIYAILNQLLADHRCKSIHVASRGLKENHLFFYGMQRQALIGCPVDAEFKFTDSGEYFKKSIKKLFPNDFDMVMMRLPRPISDDFLLWVEEVFSKAIVINKPSGIMATSNKKFLVNFPDLCPTIRLCNSIDTVKEEIKKYPIVLKPLKGYSGIGLLKINGDVVDDGKKEYDTEKYLESIKDVLEEDGYLSMRYLKNVDQGDKRILVIGGHILAASLRLPAQDSWLCNVAQGGTSIASKATIEEFKIIERINPSLSQKGILIYGVDTLVDDDGKRVLSEINTLSVGGFPQVEAQTQKPIIKTLINKIFEYAGE